jgi:glucan-binding YG repeat protein
MFNVDSSLKLTVFTDMHSNWFLYSEIGKRKYSKMNISPKCYYSAEADFCEELTMLSIIGKFANVPIDV